jgi:hypothetical protein
MESLCFVSRLCSYFRREEEEEEERKKARCELRRRGEAGRSL